MQPCTISLSCKGTKIKLSAASAEPVSCILIYLYVHNMKNIQNILFDLGGVLLNINYQRTENAFAALGIPNFHEQYHQFFANPLFSALETGQTDEADFFLQLSKQTGVTLTEQQITQAWNAMLLDWRTESIALLPQLAKQYRLFLLSNTNAIHHNAFQESYTKQFNQSFDLHFEAAYYSHLIQQRKPHDAAFQYVLNQHQLNAATTLFIDDSLPNIEAAAALGFQTIHLTEGMRIETLGL